MAAAPEAYAGREQAYVKHFLLENYLSDLFHKIAGGFGHIVYVDGFSGPWQSAGENYSDTSFGIALKTLSSAKETWKARGKNVIATAFLVEKNQLSFSKLEGLKESFSDLNLITYNANFIDVADTLASQIPRDAFTFLFIDPKGWKIEMAMLKSLFSLRNCEIVFNFMFQFVNRAAYISDPAITKGLNELITAPNWRQKILDASESSTEERKRILVEAFSSTIAQIGGFEYVADTTIFRPMKDQPLYSLIYATRKPKGIEVFRNCQIKTLREQSAVRDATRSADMLRAKGQHELFGLSEMKSNTVEIDLQEQARLAKEEFLTIVRQSGNKLSYADIWPKILSRFVISKPEMNAIAADARKQGLITIPNWGVRQRTPHEQSQIKIGS